MRLLSSQDRQNLIYTIILNGPLFFMSATTIMGTHYSDEEGAGPLYKVYMGVLFILGSYPIFKKLFTKELSAKAALPLFVIAVYIILGYAQLPPETSFFVYLVCFSIPAIGVALCIDQNEGLKGIMKWFDLFLPFFAFSFIFMVKNMMLVKLEGNHAAYGQSTSYFSAFCFVVDLYLIRYNDYPKFCITEKKWYRKIRIGLLPYFIIICFFSGGRGASVLLLVALFLHLGLIKKFFSQNLGKFLIVLLLIIVVASIALKNLSGDYLDLFITNFDRITALVDGGSINTNASSGRDNIWLDAINTWAESPLWGLGLFSYMEVFYIRPHNIFLEIMLQGGLLLLTVFCFILLRCFFKYRKMVNRDRGQIYLMPFVLFSATQLMFSSSYWFETFFWFILVYIYYYKFRFVRNKYQ